jgi:hypothetical protein
MIVLYKGSRGRGKTLSMVKDAYKYYLNGYRILSNIKLKFGDYIESADVLELDRDSKLFNCVLVLDELQLFFDSRNFSKDSNKNFSNFIQQIRKRNIIILACTQYQNAIDLRLRQHIDVIAFPDFDKDNQLCMVRYFDLTVLEDIEMNPQALNIKPNTVVFNPKQVYKLYDTYEMLK